MSYIAKAEQAKNHILNSLNRNNDNELLSIMELDLSSLQSVREFADRFNAKQLKIDYLINNGGVRALPKYCKSKDGFELVYFSLICLI